MLSRVLRSGDRIELVRYGYVEGEETVGSRLTSSVIDVLDDHSIRITPIHDDVHNVISENGDQFDIRFITSDGSYTCRAEISNIVKQHGEYILTIRTLSDLQRDRRRKYFRVDAVRPISYRCIGTKEEADRDAPEYGEEGSESVGEMPFISGTLANISGGGMKFTSQSPLRWDDVIESVFLLSDEDHDPITVKGHVIYTESAANKNLRYEHRVEFIDISSEIKEKIIQFVFFEEQKQRNCE